MKRLLLPLLAVIAFSIPVFTNWEDDYVVLKEFNWDWVTDDMVDALPVILVIIFVILVLIIFLLVEWLAPTLEEQEAEERRIKQYKKEKLISYGHDMKGLEEKYREVKIYREED